MVNVKRVYEMAKREDGFRILVDRLWPRGLSKRSGSIDLWLKEIAPSTDLRKWFAHDVSKWGAFRRKYLAELKQNQELLNVLRDLEAEHGTITLLYAAKDEKHNQAIVLGSLIARKV